MKTFRYILAVIIAVLTANITMATEAADDDDYVPVVREGVVWGHYYYGSYFKDGSGINADHIVFYREELKGDTIIDGKTYKKCYRYGNYGINEPKLGSTIISFMREENKKVYVRANYSDNNPWLKVVNEGYFGDYDGELLVYDFNVSKVGDSLASRLHYDPEVVKRISKITIDGKSRKIFSTNMGNTYIEGIGMVDGLTCDFALPCCDVAPMTGHDNVCRIMFECKLSEDRSSHAENVIVYKTPYFCDFQFYDYGRQDEFYSGIEDVKVQTKAKFATGGEGEISINCQSDEDTDYAVYDVKGATVTQGTAVSGTTHIPMPAGAYIVKVGTQSQKVIVK